MSKTAETFAKDFVETAMINAVDFSVTKMKQDHDDDNGNNEVEKEINISSAILQQFSPQNTKETNLDINQILRQVAQLAENINEDLKNVQIGDYVVSMNASPLEIQVKQAISSLAVPDNKSLNKICTKGEGDGEHQDATADDNINECIIKDSSNPPTSSSLQTIDAVNPLLATEQKSTGSLKRKKDLTLGAEFCFSIYDADGSNVIDAYDLGNVLRALNLNPTNATIEKMGGTKKRNEKKITLEEFLPIFSDVKKDKDQGTYEDFLECLKLYDKSENGTMLAAELSNMLLTLGDKLEDAEVDITLKECMDEEDEDGFIPYARKDLNYL
ncbi:hypothetical protein PV326_008249 [Microctonus aethiopoides]|nr:hypothetical protein PV326_008249 [Microctonus aethiopoides]